MHLKVLNNTDFPKFLKVFGRRELINIAGLLCLGLPDDDCMFGLIYMWGWLWVTELFKVVRGVCSVCVTGDGWKSIWADAMALLMVVWKLISLLYVVLISHRNYCALKLAFSGLILFSCLKAKNERSLWSFSPSRSLFLCASKGKTFLVMLLSAWFFSQLCFWEGS